MSSRANLERWRPFRGLLRPARLRFVPLWLALVGVARRKRIPLFLLLVPPLISGTVFSFIVYAKFTLESGQGVPGTPLPAGGTMVTTMAGRMIQVHEQFLTFARTSSAFALLVIAWYGAGLVCDDRRTGAHLLWFARPLTRRDYLLAQLATAATFGSFAVLVPGLMICTVAVFSSPDYSFLLEKWQVIAGTIGYSLVFVLSTSLYVLAISSVVERKTHALAGFIGSFAATTALGGVLFELGGRERGWFLVSLWANFQRLGDWMLGATKPRSGLDWNPWWSVLVLGALALLSLATISWRLRRMERGT